MIPIKDSESGFDIHINELINSPIILNKKDHSYKLKSDPDILFNNVTNIVESQFPPFKREIVARWLVNNTRKYQNYTTEGLLKEWKNIKNLGTKTHLQIDKYIKSGTKPTLQKAKHAIDWYDNTIYEYGSKQYSEIIVFSKELAVAGSVDLLVYDPSKNECTIFDWKTSKKIESTRGKAAITEACYGLTGCRFDQFSLQLSMYAYLLNKYHKIPITKQFMVHLTEYSANCIEADNHLEIVEQIFINNSRDENINESTEVKKDNYKVGLHTIGYTEYYFDKCPYDGCSRQFKVKAFYGGSDIAIHKEYECFECGNQVHYAGPETGFLTESEYYVTTDNNDDEEFEK